MKNVGYAIAWITSVIAIGVPAAILVVRANNKAVPGSFSYKLLGKV